MNNRNKNSVHLIVSLRGKEYKVKSFEDETVNKSLPSNFLSEYGEVSFGAVNCGSSKQEKLINLIRILSSIIY